MPFFSLLLEDCLRKGCKCLSSCNDPIKSVITSARVLIAIPGRLKLLRDGRNPPCPQADAFPMMHRVFRWDAAPKNVLLASPGVGGITQVLEGKITVLKKGILNVCIYIFKIFFILEDALVFGRCAGNKSALKRGEKTISFGY